MRRLKDLTAYSLTHAEIMVQREGVELLALAMFFGAASEPLFHKNQKLLPGFLRGHSPTQARPNSLSKRLRREWPTDLLRGQTTIPILSNQLL